MQKQTVRNEIKHVFVLIYEKNNNKILLEISERKFLKKKSTAQFFVLVEFTPTSWTMSMLKLVRFDGVVLEYLVGFLDHDQFLREITHPNSYTNI